MAHTQHYSSNYISFSTATLRLATELDADDTVTIRLVADDSTHDEKGNIFSSYACQGIHLTREQAQQLAESLSALTEGVSA